MAFGTNLLGRFDSSSQLALNTPAGTIHARVEIQQDLLPRAFFKNIPSFVYMRDKIVNLPVIGDVTFDIAFGGAFCAIIDASSLKLELKDANANALIDHARLLKMKILEDFVVEHPLESELSTLFGVIFTGEAHDAANHSRNVTVYEDSCIDRSPTGTGLSARCALLLAQDTIDMDEVITVESIVGSTMTVRAVEKVTYGSREAVIPEIGGTAHVTGLHELYFDSSDPYRYGFAIK